ncbi:hypothetical protein BDV95DRAFT_623880 [Massariosphaeria phaeospora]|uniref:Rhodopsin domain-containing protein n=1 Tax=Massariosphaeria phaeospora TaxID=100035 RepID=A0A7C8I666_9PLEO|nr:hypothetical protein BDV95DRAFT_623880 [Massariosphaeria phaeospora]
MPLTSLRPVGGGIALIVIASIFIPLTVLTVALRLWARQKLRQKLELNDYLILIGAIFAVANAVLTIVGVIYGGVGRHQQEALALYPTLAKVTLGLALLWTLANTFVKLSIIHLYMVIFKTRRFRYASYAVTFLTIGYCVTNCVQNLLTCRPVAFNWDKTIPGGRCSTQRSPFLASAIINMSIDVIIFALPMPMLWRLHLNQKKKIPLIIIFGLGFLICILSAIRTSSIARLNYVDYSYSVLPDGIYSVLEPCCGTINACLPMLQPVVSKIVQTRFISRLRGISRSTAPAPSLAKVHNSNPGTIGSSGNKQRFIRIDEEITITHEDEYPLTNISSTRERRQEF